MEDSAATKSAADAHETDFFQKLFGRTIQQYDDPNIAKNVPGPGSGPAPAPGPLIKRSEGTLGISTDEDTGC